MPPALRRATGPISIGGSAAVLPSRLAGRAGCGQLNKFVRSRGAVAAVLALVASGATAFSHTPALAWGLVRYPRRVHAARCGMQCPVYDAPGAQVRVDGRADGAVR